MMLSLRRSVAAFGLSTSIVTIALGQTGSIRGRVQQKDGGPLVGVVVEVQESHLKAKTGVNGEYAIDALPPGTYTLTASMPQFHTTTATVTVVSGETSTQDFSLVLDFLSMEAVVVTGTHIPEKNIESSRAITTLTSEDVANAAPRSTTEYLRRVPGFTRVESSGGEVNQNLSIRGLLGVESVNFQEDGMPVYPTMHVFFMNADNLVRPDENVQEIEVLRGGSSPIFGSSTTGAIVNFVNKTGGDTLGGSLKGLVGTSGLGRFDLDANGPLATDWRFNIGGFYRYDHGVRDPGFPGIKGGQVKLGVTRLLSNGSLAFSAKHIDDRNQFILPLPFENPDDPKYVPGFSDTGSFSTPEAVGLHVPLPGNNSDLQLPLDDGIHTVGNWFTADLTLGIGGGWLLKNIAQSMSADHQWNALLPFDVLTADGYVDSLIGQGQFPAGSTGAYVFTNVKDTSGNKLPFNTANDLVAPGGLWHVEKPIRAFQDNLTFEKTAGRHAMAFGGYFAYYTQGNKWFFTDVLTDVRDNPHMLDLVITEPGGATVDVTHEGFRHFLSNYVNGDGSTSLAAVFASDRVRVTDRMRLDFGARFERAGYFLRAENTTTFDLDGDPDTPYDVELFGDGTFKTIDTNVEDVAASVGLNYQVIPNRMAVYGSFTRGFWMPALDEFLFETQGTADIFEPRNTYMGEAGVKYTGPSIGYTVTGFYGKLYNVTSRGVEVDPISGLPIFVSRSLPDTTGWGFELELATKPARWVDLRFATTLVDVSAPAGAQAPTFYKGFTPAVADFDAGFLVARNTRFQLDWHYVGERFSNPAQTIKLEAYTYGNVGVSHLFSAQRVTLAAKVLNCTQSHGFEEGNPRVDQTRGEAAQIFLARPILPRRFTLEARLEF